MPTGKLTDPGGPGAKKGLGSILGTDGKCYLFKNPTNPGELKKGDPIVFYTDPAKVDLLNEIDEEYDIAVAYLHLDGFKQPYLTYKIAWDSSFKALWDNEWEKDETIIEELGLIDGFRDNTFKEGLQKIEGFQKIRQINP